MDDDQGGLACLEQSYGKAELIAVSIVSHGHGAMVDGLISALSKLPEVSQIIVTRNIPEKVSSHGVASITEIENVLPRGFGANHNAAFAQCRQPFFCPLNPDIEITGNPFPQLLSALDERGVALVAPLILAPDGRVEDSVRRFPGVFSLLRKAVGGNDGRYQVTPGQHDFYPEWVAGMFMLFGSAYFKRLGGFDEHFFLYYEDVDICVRAWRQGMQILVCPQVAVIHDARRDSHRSLRHLRWHLKSMARYFLKHWGRLPHVA